MQILIPKTLATKERGDAFLALEGGRGSGVGGEERSAKVSWNGEKKKRFIPSAEGIRIKREGQSYLTSLKGEAQGTERGGDPETESETGKRERAGPAIFTSEEKI